MCTKFWFEIAVERDIWEDFTRRQMCSIKVDVLEISLVCLDWINLAVVLHTVHDNYLIAMGVF
jgi:hypothetical protein